MVSVKRTAGPLEKPKKLRRVKSTADAAAGIAAAAHFPALTIPMGYRKNGQPKNITFITRSNNEQLLYNLGFHYERVSMRRKTPDIYR